MFSREVQTIPLFREGSPERYIYYLAKKPELSPLLTRFPGLLDEKPRQTEGIIFLL